LIYQVAASADHHTSNLKVSVSLKTWTWIASEHWSFQDQCSLAIH